MWLNRRQTHYIRCLGIADNNIHIPLHSESILPLFAGHSYLQWLLFGSLIRSWREKLRNASSLRTATFIYFICHEIRWEQALAVYENASQSILPLLLNHWKWRTVHKYIHNSETFNAEVCTSPTSRLFDLKSRSVVLLYRRKITTTTKKCHCSNTFGPNCIYCVIKLTLSLLQHLQQLSISCFHLFVFYLQRQKERFFL